MRHVEVFGPVAPISTFDDEDEAVAAANDTESGLVSYVFTSDLDRALRVCRAAGDRAWSASTRAWCRTRRRRSAG